MLRHCSSVPSVETLLVCSMFPKRFRVIFGVIERKRTRRNSRFEAVVAVVEAVVEAATVKGQRVQMLISYVRVDFLC